MDIKEKISQSLAVLSDEDLARVERLVEELKNKKSRRTSHLRTYDLGGKYDQTDIRDVAYE